MLKYNARQTYTTSGFTGAAFRAICAGAGADLCKLGGYARRHTLGNLLGRQILIPMVDTVWHSWPCTLEWKPPAARIPPIWLLPARLYNTPIAIPADGQWSL